MIDERMKYTKDRKGFILRADDGQWYEVPTFAEAYNKEKFYDLMKKGGKARDWVARHNLFGYYVKEKDIEGNPLTDDEARLQALPRYICDESFYDEDNYFWIKIDGFEKPLIAQLRISNHNTMHSQYEKSHVNFKPVDCQTCLNIIIGNKAYNRMKFEAASGDNAVISVETIFDEENRTPEQIQFLDTFVENVVSGKQPPITMNAIREYIDPNPKIIITQGGRLIDATEAVIRNSQYDLTRKNRIWNRLPYWPWDDEEEENEEEEEKVKEEPFVIPKTISLSYIINNQVFNNGVEEHYVDRKDNQEYYVFLYKDKRFAYDGKERAYYIKTNGNLSKDNPIDVLQENRYRRNKILEDEHMKIFSKVRNGLRKLGEGKIYSKKDISLNEDVTGKVFTKRQLKLSEGNWINGKVALTLNPNGQDVNASDVQTSSENMLNNVSQATAVTVQSDDVKGVTAPKFAPDDPRNDAVHNIPAKKATSSAIQNLAKDGGTINITKDDPQQSSMESKETSKKLVEMRRNSIPFSKKELSKFLRSL